MQSNSQNTYKQTDNIQIKKERKKERLLLTTGTGTTALFLSSTALIGTSVAADAGAGVESEFSGAVTIVLKIRTAQKEEKKFKNENSPKFFNNDNLYPLWASIYIH